MVTSEYPCEGRKHKVYGNDTKLLVRAMINKINGGL
jgi:hypothetical protein